MYKFTVILFFLIVSVINAQSDYEYVQNFKKETTHIKSQITNAKTLVEIRDIRGKIEKTRKKYYSRKEFLNKAIYPENFEKIFSNLQNALDSKEQQIAEIEKAKTKITQLNSYVRQLSENYLSLVNELEELNTDYKKSKEILDVYKRKLSYLKKNIKTRDSLLTQQLQNLLTIQKRMTAEGSENDIENKEIKISNNNFLSDLTTLLNDNIRYLDYAEVTSDELFSILDEQKRLKENLEKLNPQSLALLLKDQTAVTDLTNVKSLNELWGNKIENRIAREIGKDFSQYGIALNDSSGVETLYNSMLDYLEKESVKAGNQYEREHKYKLFKNSAWEGMFKKKWLPELLKNGMFTNQKVETVETLLDEWERRNEKSSPILLYIIVGAILIFITIYVAAKGKKTKYLRKAAAQKKKNEYDKIKREKEIEKFREKMKKENKN